jgi:hypothetical protein
MEAGPAAGSGWGERTVAAWSLDSRLGLTKVRPIVTVNYQAGLTGSGSPVVSGPTANVSWTSCLTACLEMIQRQ